jgi:hypothetical protein
MTERGQINPITITADGNLITGGRRLRAAQQLGWDEINVQVWRPADAEELLKVERDENICRKDLTTVEAERYQKFWIALLKPKTTAARIEGNRKGAATTNRTNRTNQVAPNVGETSRRPPVKKAGTTTAHTRRAVNQAAVRAGYSAETLRKVTTIRKIANNPEENDIIRKEAERQLELLQAEETNPTNALKEVTRTRKVVKMDEDHAALPGKHGKPAIAPIEPEAGIYLRLIQKINKGNIPELASLTEEVIATNAAGMTPEQIKDTCEAIKTRCSALNALSRALKNTIN